MDRPEVSLGIDLGTSGVQVDLVDVQGAALAVWAELYGSLDIDPGAVGPAVFLPCFAAERLPPSSPRGVSRLAGAGSGLGSNRRAAQRDGVDGLPDPACGGDPARIFPSQLAP